MVVCAELAGDDGEVRSGAGRQPYEASVERLKDGIKVGLLGGCDFR